MIMSTMFTSSALAATPRAVLPCYSESSMYSEKQIQLEPQEIAFSLIFLVFSMYHAATKAYINYHFFCCLDSISIQFNFINMTNASYPVLDCYIRPSFKKHFHNLSFGSLSSNVHSCLGPLTVQSMTRHNDTQELVCLHYVHGCFILLS